MAPIRGCFNFTAQARFIADSDLHLSNALGTARPFAGLGSTRSKRCSGLVSLHLPPGSRDIDVVSQVENGTITVWNEEPDSDAGGTSCTLADPLLAQLK